jgi:hypothetical protein
MTLNGVNQVAVRLDRVETQMSVDPTPPDRSEPNQSVSPSAEIAELVSNVAVLSWGIGIGVSNGRRGSRRRANQTSPLPVTRSEVK